MKIKIEMKFDKLNEKDLLMLKQLLDLGEDYDNDDRDDEDDDYDDSNDKLIAWQDGHNHGVKVGRKGGQMNKKLLNSYNEELQKDFLDGYKVGIANYMFY